MRNRIHLMHIPKTGGTAIRHALHDDQNYGDNEIVFHPHKTVLKDIPETEQVIVFVRDPVSRFVSAFYSRKRKGKPRCSGEWTIRERKVFENFETPGEMAEALAGWFGSSKKIASEAMGYGHFRSLTHWFGSLDYLKSRPRELLFAGSQESLDRDFQILKDRFKLPDFCELPTDEYNTHKAPQDQKVDKNISQRGLKALKKWYRRDFETLAYLKPGVYSS